MNFCVVNESGLTPDEIKTLLLGSADHIAQYAPAWKFGAITVTSGTPLATDIPCYITVRNRRTGAAGYHGVENGKPAIYVLPNTAFNRYGTWRKALVQRLTGKVILPEYKREGTLSVLCHEIAEVLGDPLVKTVSTPDKNGHQWLVEIADPVVGFPYMKVINGHNCIFPDIALPSFYDVNGLAPYSIAKSPKAPFTIPDPAKGYAYWKDKLGALFKVS
jgi:hypothetical protein